jgi:thiol-disulfide isomerase/thioredoxin
MVLSHLKNRVAWLVAATAVLAAGCQAGTTSAMGPVDTPLSASGAFAANIDAADFTVSYQGLKATATMTHQINKDPGGLACVPALSVAVAQPDGTCKLQLDYEAGFQGEGLQLKSVKFWARALIDQGGGKTELVLCPGWTSKEPSSTEVVYASTVATGTLPLELIGQPEAGMAKAILRNRTLAPTFGGPVTMKYLGRHFTVDLSQITFKGDITSTGDENAQCVKTFHDFPAWQLQDINPGSALHDTTYGLDAFKGKKVVVALVSDWCASCRSQAQMMQKLQDQAIATGHADTVMVLIADKQTSNSADLLKMVKTIPVFQDTPQVDAWAKMNEGHASKFKGSEIRNSGYGFAKNGSPIMYFEPSGTGTLDLGKYESAVNTVIQAKDD